MTRNAAIFLVLGVAAAALAFLILADGRRGEAPSSAPIDDAERDDRAARSERDASRIVGARYEESEEAPPEPTIPMAAFRVTRADKSPVAKARLKLRPGSLGPVTTDAAGVARVPAQEDVSAEFTLAAPGAAELKGRVMLDEGEHAIVIPEKGAIRGFVTVNGRPPKAPVKLELRRTEPDRFIPQMARSIPIATTMSDAAGGFEFFNLPPIGSAWIDIPPEYRIATEPGASETYAVAVKAPSAGVAMRLVERAALVGRIVLAKDKLSPLRRISAKATITRAEATDDVRIDPEADGHFCVEVGPDADRAVVRVSDERGLYAKSVEARGPFDGIRDLGTFELGALREVTVIVRDAEGRPLPNAFARVKGAQAVSSPTDAKGRTEVVAEQGSAQLEVGKPGFGMVAVDVPDSASSRVEVELRKGVALTIKIEIGNGSVSPREVVRAKVSPKATFTSQGATFHDAMFRPSIFDPQMETTREYEYVHPDASGNIVLDGYAPGAHVTIQLYGVPPEEPLAERSLFLGACDESTTIRIDSEPRAFEGVVESANGTPIANALVQIFRGGGFERTSSDGSFSFPHLLANSASLEIHASGYTPLRRDRVAIDGTKQRFVLVPGPDSLENSGFLHR